MNKKFYFALAATAALFASCSSDDLSQAPGLNGAEGNPDGAIKLSIANASQGSTRGTGTVGNTDGNSAQWAGQKVNVYMLKTGTLDQAYELKDDGTDDATKPLFENQEMVVEQGQAALILDIVANATDPTWKDRTVTNKYFPGSGVYDFWGYRVDDAAKGAPNVSGTSLVVPFEIDGSQDLMSGKATPTLNANGKIDGVYGGAATEVDPSKAYSAYTARREIDPVLHFKHQLARFTFQVKGANAACCVADGETDPDKLAKAINVKEIKVKGSKYKGDLVIAYTGAAPDPITWDPATTDLLLKQRVKKVVTPAAGDYYGIKVVRATDDPTTGDARYTYTVKNAAYPGGSDVAGALAVKGTVITDALEVYDAVTPDPNTNLPAATVTKTTIGALKATLANPGDVSAEYYAYFNTAAVVYSTNPDDIDLTADLVALDPVQPIKNATDVPQKTQVGEAILLPADVNEYNIEILLGQRLVNSTKTVVDANGKAIYVDNVATPGTYYLYSAGQAAAAATPAVHDAAVAYTTQAAYEAARDADATASEQTAVADEAAAVAAAELLAIGHYYFPNTTATDGGWYVNVTAGYVAATPAVAAHYYASTNAATHMTTAAQQIPVNDVEQDATDTYHKWVTEVFEDKNMLVKQTVKLPVDPSTLTPMSFTPGMSYNVVLTINGFETIGGEGTTTPTVDAYTDYGTDIELGDDDENP